MKEKPSWKKFKGEKYAEYEVRLRNWQNEQEAMATTHRVLVEKKSCQTCELWVKTPSIARQGQCYRYPMSHISMDTHWCAEWRKK